MNEPIPGLPANTTNRQTEAQITERPANAIDRQTEAQITEVCFAEPISRDADLNSAVDIVILMRDRNGEEHTWRSEYSAAYGTGNNASRTRAQITVAALESIGWKNGDDFSTLEETLRNLVIPITIKYTHSDKNDRWWKNVYLGHGLLRKVESAKALDIIRAIAGGNTSAAAPAFAPQMTSAAKANPFASNPFAPRS